MGPRFLSGHPTASPLASSRTGSSSGSTLIVGRCRFWRTLRRAAAARGTETARSSLLRIPRKSAIFRIPATGGTSSPLTRMEATKETSHRFPQFLPDGHHFLYYVQGTPESHGIYVGDLDGSQARRLLDVDSAPVYARFRTAPLCSSGDAVCASVRRGPFGVEGKSVFGGRTDRICQHGSRIGSGLSILGGSHSVSHSFWLVAAGSSSGSIARARKLVELAIPLVLTIFRFHPMAGAWH